jgi:hypothetical protein
MPSGPGELLRTASTFNRVMGTTYSPGGSLTRRMAVRTLKTIGSGDLSFLRVRIDNKYFASDSTIKSGGAWNIIRCGLECNGSVQYVRFGGSITRSIASGETEVLSDKILPSLFGLTSFAQATVCYIRMESEIVGTAILPISENTDTGSAEGRIYDPAATTWNNFFTAGVSMGFTGTAPTTSFGFLPLLVGVYEAADARCLATVGDSIVMQGNGASYPVTAAGTISGTKPRLSQMLIGRSGGASTIFNNDPTWIRSLIKLGNVVVDEYGTNEVSFGYSTMQTRWLNAWSFIRGSASDHPDALTQKLVRPHLLVRVTGTIGADPATQTIDSGWNAGETVENLNAWGITQIGVGNGPDACAEIATGASGDARFSNTGKGTTDSTWYKWGSGMSSDGLHPVSAGSTIIGFNFRTIVDTVL